MSRSETCPVSRRRSGAGLRVRARQWWGRKSPRVFWCVEADAIVAAVIEPALGEALLLRCGAIEGIRVLGPSLVAVGLAELALGLGCTGFLQIAALGPTLSRPVAASNEAPGEDLAFVPLEGGNPERLPLSEESPDRMIQGVQVARSVVAATAAAFWRAGLELVELDSALCALRGLEDSLGEGWEDRSASRSRPSDPLAALHVAVEAEEVAMHLGERLAVPVGLALARLDEGGSWRA